MGKSDYLMKRVCSYANVCNEQSWIVEKPYIFRNPKPTMVHLYLNVGYEDYQNDIVGRVLHYYFMDHYEETWYKEGKKYDHYLFGIPLVECDKKDATIHVRSYTYYCGYVNYYYRAAA